MSDHSDQAGDAAARSMMDNLYWWGIPSLFRAAIADNPADLDIALVGVPHSTGNGTTERDQHLGPRAVRHVSANMRRAHMRMGSIHWKPGVSVISAMCLCRELIIMKPVSRRSPVFSTD